MARCPFGNHRMVMGDDHACKRCGEDMSLHAAALDLPVVFYNEARRLWDEANLDAALIWLQAALKLRSDFAEAHWLLGAIEARRGRIDFAKKHLIQAQELGADIDIDLVCAFSVTMEARGGLSEHIIISAEENGSRPLAQLMIEALEDRRYTEFVKIIREKKPMPESPEIIESLTLALDGPLRMPSDLSSPVQAVAAEILGLIGPKSSAAATKLADVINTDYLAQAYRFADMPGGASEEVSNAYMQMATDSSLNGRIEFNNHFDYIFEHQSSVKLWARFALARIRGDSAAGVTLLAEVLDFSEKGYEVLETLSALGTEAEPAAPALLNLLASHWRNQKPPGRARSLLRRVRSRSSSPEQERERMRRNAMAERAATLLEQTAWHREDVIAALERLIGPVSKQWPPQLYVDLLKAIKARQDAASRKSSEGDNGL